MGAGKGIRTCALLGVTTVATTDHRYLCPAPSVAAKAGPYNGSTGPGTPAHRRSHSEVSGSSPSSGPSSRMDRTKAIRGGLSPLRAPPLDQKMTSSSE